MPSTNRLYFYLRIFLFAVYFINGIIVINSNSVEVMKRITCLTVSEC